MIRTMRRTTLATLIGLYALSGNSAAWAFSDCDNYYHSCRGFVVPCSLDGVNPIYHPSIFGNPAIARQDYGFIRSPDGTWHVEKNCVRGLHHGG
jgi:hypothetical protein